MRFWICLLLVFLPLLAEWLWLKKVRRRLPLRVHVHGSRGKSSTTRYLAANLRQAGLRTLAKTTGDKPELILPDGRVQPIRRLGPARIQEQIRMLGLASKHKAQVVVLEGMALQPETIWASEKIIQANYAVITNTRPDHAETMGPDRAGVIDALSLIIPDDGVLYTAREEGAEELCLRAAAKNSACRTVPWNAPQEQPLALASALAVELVDFADKSPLFPPLLPAGSPSGLTEPAPDEPVALRAGERQGVFFDFLSANDVESSRLLWQERAPRLAPGAVRIAMLCTRADRPLRTRAFLDWFKKESNFDLYIIVGSHAWYAGLTGGRDIRDKRLGRLNFWPRPEKILDEIGALPGAQSFVLAGFGNSHGYGEKWRDYLTSLEIAHAG